MIKSTLPPALSSAGVPRTVTRKPISSARAAAVGLKLDNGEPMWQRPIGGWALFPGPFNETSRFTLTIYDEAGTVIGTHSR